MRSFYEIAKAHGTDKVDAQHMFHPFYERHLGHLRTQKFTLLEIGVLRGASMRTWREYFPHARLMAVDIDEIPEKTLPPGVEFFRGDQLDPQFLQRVAYAAGGFDVIIEDGGHRMDQQKMSFSILFPHVRPDGYYVIEDSATSYVPKYGGGPSGHPGTTMEMLKKLIGDLDHRPRKGSLFGHQEPRVAPGGSVVSGIHFYSNIVFIEKGV